MLTSPTSLPSVQTPYDRFVAARRGNFSMAAVVAVADEVGGQYCENCHIGKIVPDDVTNTMASEGARSYALDPKNAEALWKKREEMVGELFLKGDGMTVQVCRVTDYT